MLSLVTGFPATGVPTPRGWESRSSEAYHRIRQMIFDGSVLPGQALTEAQFVRVLDMSRTPVREALHRLEAEGLLESLTRGGYSVVALSDGDLANLYRIRAVLEGLAAETAASQLSRVDIARLEDLYDEMGVAVRERNDAQLVSLNRDFHRAIAVASGNRHLVETLDNVKGVFERFRSSAVANDVRREQAHEEHGQIIAALKDRKADTARDLAELHVKRALDRGTRDGMQLAADLSETGSRPS